jgi:hypothetical protein
MKLHETKNKETVERLPGFGWTLEAVYAHGDPVYVMTSDFGEYACPRCGADISQIEREYRGPGSSYRQDHCLACNFRNKYTNADTGFWRAGKEDPRREGETCGTSDAMFNPEQR